MCKFNAKALRYKAIKNKGFSRPNGLSIVFINRLAELESLVIIACLSQVKIIIQAQVRLCSSSNENAIHFL